MQIRDDDEREEQAFRQLLVGHDEPTPIATPQHLAQQVLARLPQQPPALAARRAWRATLVQRLSLGSGLALAMVLLLLGTWSVLVDSSLPLRLVAASGLAEALLVLTLAVKPLVGVMLAQATLFGAAFGVLLLGGALWWRVLQRVPAYAAVRVRQ